MKPLTLRQFIKTFIRVPDDAGALVPLRFHPAQEQVIAAVDRHDPVTGRRPYRTVLISWPKKAGKSTTAAAIALWELFADTANGPDREIIIIASDLAQSRDVVFQQCVRMVERDARLSRLAKITQTEITFREKVKDPQTGGTYTQAHVIRAVPVDVRGTHGLAPALVCADEVHGWGDDLGYEILEALAPPPTRPNPLWVFSSYAGLRSAARPGSLWYDYWTRGQAQTDPAMFASILTGPDAWKSIPWITQDWVDGMRRSFEMCPSKFTRLVENSWAQSEHSLITTQELQDAMVHLDEPEYGERGQVYAMGIDLGLTHDATAICVLHVDAISGKATVDVMRSYQGTPDQPVSLMAVEDEVVSLFRRFRPKRIVADQWQAAHLIERCRHRGVENMRAATIEPAKLDLLTTMLKDLFAKRAIAIPARELDLREQLEWLEVEEAGGRGRRRDRIKFLPGGKTGPGAHDDLVVAMMLAAEVLQGEAGRWVLPPMRTCYRAQNQGGSPSCYLIHAGGGYYPPGNDPDCSQCAGHVGLQRIYHGYLARGGVPYEGGIRHFYRERVKPNDYVSLFKYSGAVRSLGL